MPGPAADKILLTGLLDHPAVEAWRGLRPERVEPHRIEVVKAGRKAAWKRAIYRLEGVGRAGSAVIAKRCAGATAQVERAVYAEVLPHLRVSYPHYYGSVEGPGGEFCWLFLEDAGGEKYCPQDEGHRALAVRWLGRVHTGAVSVAATARLPDQGPGGYLGELRAARATIRQSLPNPALAAADRATLGAVLGQLDVLESRWDRVGALCDGVPRTLVHGDFVHKNLRVRTTPAAAELLPFDWETAGWGVPAADVALVDAPAYWEVVREAWGHLGLRGVERLAELGRLFRLLAAVRWASLSLAREWVGNPMGQMRYYLTHLSAALRSAGWAG
jgi:hypothetical protein